MLEHLKQDTERMYGTVERAVEEEKRAWSSHFLDRFSTLCSVSTGACLGVWLRMWIKGKIGLVNFESYLLAQFLGSFIAGFMRRNEYNEMVTKGIVIGFCGSLTTFSSWMLLTSNLIVQLGSFAQVERFLLWIQYTVNCLAVGLFGYMLGYRHGYIWGKQSRSANGDIIGIIGCAFTLLYMFLQGSYEEKITLGCGILGANLRWALTILNQTETFPGGTFFANTLGCTLIAIAFTHSIPHRQAIMDGFCGALSTLSTFVGETYHMNTIDAYVYIVITLLINQIIITTILTLGPF